MLLKLRNWKSEENVEHLSLIVISALWWMMSLHCGGREQVSVSSCALLQSMFGRWLSKVLPTHVWGLSTVSLHKKLDLMTLPVILSAVEAGTAWSLEVVTLASSWVLCLGRDYISKRKKNKIKWKCDQGGHCKFKLWSKYTRKQNKCRSRRLRAGRECGALSRLSNHPDDLNS